MTPLYQKDGFIICFEALLEEISMRKHFVDDCGWTEQEFEELENISPLWFCAKVSAWRDGKELGADYLGGCCYNSTDDFISGDYMESMADAAIADAVGK